MPIITKQFLPNKIRIGEPYSTNKGALCVPVRLDFSTEAQITLDPGTAPFLRSMEKVQTLYVDNSNNPAGIAIYVPDTQQLLTAPAFGHAYLPVLMTSDSSLVFTNYGGNLLDVHFINVQIPAFVWGSGNVNAPDFTASTGFTYAGYANPTDTAFILATTKNIALFNFGLACRATAAAQLTVTIEIRQGLGAGGTIVDIPINKTNPLSPDAPTARLGWYTAAPAAGTLLGTIKTQPILTSTLTAFPAGSGIITTPDDLFLKAGQALVINFGGAALPAGFQGGFNNTLATGMPSWREYV